MNDDVKKIDEAAMSPEKAGKMLHDIFKKYRERIPELYQEFLIYGTINGESVK